MIKKLIPAILSISIFLAGSVPTFAAQIDTEVGKNDITVEEIYTSANSDTTYNFDEKIEKDGHKYKLKGINYQVIGEDNLYYKKYTYPQIKQCIENINRYVQKCNGKPIRTDFQKDSISAYCKKFYMQEHNLNRIQEVVR